MNKYKIGVLRVLTTDDQKALNLHGRLLEKYFPQFRTETRCIPEQYDGIYDEQTLKLAEPKIIRLATAWAGSIDGLIISCAGDPAVAQLKKMLSIPVTGAGTATAAYSLNFGDKIGIIGIEEKAPANYNCILGDKAVNYIRPEGVNTTKDLQTRQGQQAVIKAGMQLKEQGAQAIALACTGMSTAGIAALLQEKISIPVVDPVLAEGIVMLGKVVC
ncbi:MAG: aspartate/glutamate racemase family protein [Firmicutes bacterium]|nr:aspartate/glutamate racemase family protein [Bacillota bacterium]